MECLWNVCSPNITKKLTGNTSISYFNRTFSVLFSMLYMHYFHTVTGSVHCDFYATWFCSSWSPNLSVTTRSRCTDGWHEVRRFAVMEEFVLYQWEWIPEFHNHGCQAGSIRHRLSGLIAAPTNVVTFVSAPSNSAKSKRGLDRMTWLITRTWFQKWCTNLV